jgi:hypothetical protein
MDTSGLANGAHKIESTRETKVIQVGGENETLPVKQESVSATPSSSSGSFESASSAGVAVTPKVVSWYANQVGLDPNNAMQYAKAETNLNSMMSGGY